MAPTHSATVVFVPGYGNAGPGHWQRLWHEAMPGSVWVEQADWHHPERDAWVEGVRRAVAVIRGPVLFVAHSLGSLTVAEWSLGHEHRVAGALLVAVPDPESRAFPASIRGFGPPVRTRLPFSGRLVASRTDPYMSLARSRDLARDWGCVWHDLGDAGHINAASGFGPWPEGRRLLAQLRP